MYFSFARRSLIRDQTDFYFSPPSALLDGTAAVRGLPQSCDSSRERQSQSFYLVDGEQKHNLDGSDHSNHRPRSKVENPSAPATNRFPVSLRSRQGIEVLVLCASLTAMKNLYTIYVRTSNRFCSVKKPVRVPASCTAEMITTFLAQPSIDATRPTRHGSPWHR